MIKNTDSTRLLLAQAVVEAMDMDDLIDAMVDQLEEDYHHDDDLFQNDWDYQFSDED